MGNLSLRDTEDVGWNMYLQCAELIKQFREERHFDGNSSAQPGELVCVPCS